MSLSEIFSNPLEPCRSIQLNNRHWPGEKYRLLGIIVDAESMIAAGELSAAARHLRRLKSHFRSDALFSSFLRRLHRLHSFRSAFGYATGRLALTEASIAANQYRGQDTRATYPLASIPDFAAVIRETADLYKAQYGADFVKTNCTVRFAIPDERQADVTNFGVLSNYHNDEYKGISTIIYLSSVKEENGAFSFIRDSHLIPRSLVLTAIHQCMDFDLRLTQPQHFAPFPLEFRGSIGIDVLLDNDKTEILSRYREVLEGDVGTFVTFNGQYLFHRGGKPLAGSRTAAFLQPEGMARHKMASIGSLVYALANR